MRTRWQLAGIVVLVVVILIGVGVSVIASANRGTTGYFSASWDPRLDLDNDGDVDVLDIQMVAAGWQTKAPTPTPLPGGCTAIGGPYFQDTIFPSGCYSVTQSLQVPNNVTMTLQAGGTFYFCQTCNLYVDETGVLLVQGTDSSRVSLVPSGSAWRGVLFNGTNRTKIPSVIDGASIANVRWYGSQSAVMISSGWLRVNNARISGSDIGINLSTTSSASGQAYTVTGSLVENNQTGVELYDWGWSSSTAIAFGHNTVRSNSSRGVHISRLGSDSTKVTFTGNNIYANSGFDVYYEDDYLKKDADFANCWWGTTDSAVISEHIWDYYDDITLGKVLFQPFATAPIPGAP